MTKTMRPLQKIRRDECIAHGPYTGKEVADLLDIFVDGFGDAQNEYSIMDAKRAMLLQAASAMQAHYERGQLSEKKIEIILKLSRGTLRRMGDDGVEFMSEAQARQLAWRDSADIKDVTERRSFVAERVTNYRAAVVLGKLRARGATDSDIQSAAKYVNEHDWEMDGLEIAYDVVRLSRPEPPTLRAN